MRPVVLVTGGSRGIGAAAACLAAQQGWAVAVNYTQDVAAAQAVVDRIQGAGGLAMAVQGDLEDEASCQQLFNATVREIGTDLQCVVNNASLFEPDEARHMNEAQALQQLQVNLMAPLRLSRWLAQLHETPTAPAQPSGQASVIHVLDQKVFNLNPDYFSYTLSKLALERAVSLQAQALAPTLRVNGVAPGLMYLSGPQSQDNFDKASQANLMRRPLNPRHVADSVVFLANNAGITGTTLRVDNGQHLVPSPRDIMFVTEAVMNGVSP